MMHAICTPMIPRGIETDASSSQHGTATCFGLPFHIGGWPDKLYHPEGHWSFRVMDMNGNSITIDQEIGEPLGLVNGSQVFSTMFRYEGKDTSSHEIVLSTFGPENYRLLYDLTINMIDQPGACAQASKFLADRNVDILNSESLSMISGAVMVWKMLVDLSYFGEPDDLIAEFSSAKRNSPSSLDKVDSMKLSESHIADRYTKGAISASRTIKTKMIKRKSRTPSQIRKNEFVIPEEFMAELGSEVDGRPFMMVGDMNSYVLSITMLDPSVRLISVNMTVPDKPGAIHQVADAMSRSNVNLLMLHTKVLNYYESMSLDVVADVSKCSVSLDELRARIEVALSSFKSPSEVGPFKPIVI